MKGVATLLMVFFFAALAGCGVVILLGIVDNYRSGPVVNFWLLFLLHFMALVVVLLAFAVGDLISLIWKEFKNGF